MRIKLGWLSLNCNKPQTFISFRLLLFLIFLVVQILLFFIHHIIKNAVAAIKLSPDLYLLKPGESYHKYRSRLLLQNSTGRAAAPASTSLLLPGFGVGKELFP